MMKVPVCPNCGSKKLVRIDELNPDYNCVDCDSIIIGLQPEMDIKSGKP